MCRNVSEDHKLFIEHLRNIGLLHTLVNSHTLNLNSIQAVIAKMRALDMQKLNTVVLSFLILWPWEIFDKVSIAFLAILRH